jgi:phosphatidylserine decarboxylase
VITLVPVAAILVASIHLSFLDVLLHLKYRGPNVITCNAALEKSQEMGWFQHGSTIIVLAPRGFSLCDGVVEAQADAAATYSRLRAPRRFLPLRDALPTAQGEG